VHPADIQDRDGGMLVLSPLFDMYPYLPKLFAEGGNQGSVFQNALAKLGGPKNLPQVCFEQRG
jgi:hypothetical protein